MTTDALYVSCIDETIRLLAESGYSTYMYTFEYQGQNSMIELVLNGAPKMFQTGVSHGDELFYLFNLKIGRLRPPSFKDDRISKRMLTLWTDFAKYGYIFCMLVIIMLFNNFILLHYAITAVRQELKIMSIQDGQALVLTAPFIMKSVTRSNPSDIIELMRHTFGAFIYVTFPESSKTF